jgi:hypothetical protein
MRYTLLEMVQQILSAMDSDDVDSINDTTESTQVALLIKGVYYDLATELDLDEHHTLFELDETSSSTPILMTVPTNVVEIENLQYDRSASADASSDYVDVPFVTLTEFLKRANSLGGVTLATGVATVDITLNGETFPIIHTTDNEPTFYTSADDYNIILNSYDSSEDAYLRKTKTLCTGIVYPTFTLSDSFTPDFNPQQFSLFLNRAKVRAFAELKQVGNVEAASEARMQKIRTQRHKRITQDLKEVYKVPRYGR